MLVTALFVRPGVSSSATNKEQRIRWQGMTISLPAKFRYDCTDTAGALLAQQYCIERFAKLKGKAPKRMEFVERFLGV